MVVLGAGGWLGSHVVEAFSTRGVQTLGVGRRAGPYITRRIDLRACSDRQLRELVEGAAAVVNCTDAANASDGWEHPTEVFEEVNVRLVRRLAQAAGRCRAAPRFIHMGSILEYGTAATHPWEESHPCDPATEYARSKLAGSRAVLEEVASGSGRGLVLRAGHLIGPRPSAASFPGRVCAALATARSAGTTADLVTTRDQRDFVDVREVARAVVLAAEAPVDGIAVNVSSGRAHPVAAVVRRLVALSGLGPDRAPVTMRELASFGGARTWASPARAAAVLGWRPSLPVEESLADMWTQVWSGTCGPARG